MKDGLYQVDYKNICASFVIENGVPVCVAPVLRSKFNYWKTIARKIDMINYGYTNDFKKYQFALILRRSLLKDGWTVAPWYKTEPYWFASIHVKNDFKIIIISRQINKSCSDFKYQVDVIGYGPDSLYIEFDYPWTYRGIEDMRNKTRICYFCKTNDVDTFKYGQSIRVCKKCSKGGKIK